MTYMRMNIASATDSSSSRITLWGASKMDVRHCHCLGHCPVIVLGIVIQGI